MSLETFSYVALASLTSALVSMNFRIVYDWLTNRKNHGSNNKTVMEEIRSVKSDTEWLRTAHDKFDADGVPMWFVPRAWKLTLDTLAERSVRTNSLLEQILEEVKHQRYALEKLTEK